MERNAHNASLTWEQAVEWYRSQPGNEAAVAANYFDRDGVAAAKRFAASPEFQETLQLLPACHRTRGAKLLEIGAGAGIASYAFATNGFDVTALEPDPSEIVGAGAIRDLAVRTAASIHVVQEWGEGLPFADEAFAVVYVRQVLHHARDLRQLCAEAARVLRPGGVLIAVREHVIRDPEDLPQFLESHPLHAMYGGEHAYLRSEYEAAISGAGLEITQVLAPFESVINYHPLPASQVEEQGFRAMLEAAGVRRGAGLVWRCAGRRLATLLPNFARRCRLALKDRYVPGNIFSFVAKKGAGRPSAT
jgi:SAM-dependent methyltransferase